MRFRIYERPYPDSAQLVETGFDCENARTLELLAKWAKKTELEKLFVKDNQKGEIFRLNYWRH